MLSKSKDLLSDYGIFYDRHKGLFTGNNLFIHLNLLVFSSIVFSSKARTVEIM